MSVASDLAAARTCQLVETWEQSMHLDLCRSLLTLDREFALRSECTVVVGEGEVERKEGM